MTEVILPHVVVGERPERLCLVLHGILGSKSNWRSFARRWAEALPGWGFVLADLRNHGEAQGFAPPHTMAAVAADLARLCASLDAPVELVAGHSFGGKSALCLAARDDAPPLKGVLLLDANPGVRPAEPGAEETLAVLDSLDAVGARFARRQDFIDAMRARGHTPGLATWLAMNLAHEGDALVMRLDVASIRAMLVDYFATDLWPVIESGDAPPIRVLAGGRSSVFTQEDVARVMRAAEAHPATRSVEVIDDAGHWLHVDAPDAVSAWVLARLRET